MATLGLFDDLQRTDRSPARATEGRFAFLNRVAGPVFVRIRALLDEWFAAYPDDGKGDMRNRLRSSDDRAFIGAFWELHQAEALRRAGFRLTFHPDLPGTDKHPDFLAEGPDESFFLETTIASVSDVNRAARRRRDVVLDAVNGVPSPNFFLGVEIDAEGLGDPSTKRLRQDLTTWMAALDPDALIATGDLETIRAHHSMVWQQDGWSLSFYPIPKSPERRGKRGRAIGVYPAEGGWIDTRGPLRRAIREKAGRYGQLDRPFVVAVLVEDAFVDDDDLLDALFGGIAVSVPVSREGPGEPRAFRLRDGSWMTGQGPTRTRVSAVVTAINLAPWSVVRIAPRTWLNPWAARPVGSDLGWATTITDPIAGAITHRPAMRMPAELFGLAEDWPGSEDPFPDE
jgi:hypothetical protein